MTQNNAASAAHAPSWAQKLAAFASKELHQLENWAEHEWQALLGALKPFAGKLEAGQWTILQELAQTALADIGHGDIPGCVQHVLMQAEVKELAWVIELGEDFLAAAIVVASANAKAAQGA